MQLMLGKEVLNKLETIVCALLASDETLHVLVPLIVLLDEVSSLRLVLAAHVVRTARPGF